MTKKDKPTGLLSPIHFSYWRCPKCGLFDEVYTGTTDMMIMRRTCHGCRAQFDLKRPKIKGNSVVMEGEFLGYTCQGCEKILSKEKPSNNLCKECQQQKTRYDKEKLNRLEQQVNQLREQIKKEAED